MKGVLREFEAVGIDSEKYTGWAFGVWDRAPRHAEIRDQRGPQIQRERPALSEPVLEPAISRTQDVA